jgi:hypothetical protein
MYAKRLDIDNPNLIKNTSFIDFQVPSFAVGVSSDSSVLEMFSESEKKLLTPYIHRLADDSYPGKPRGIPPSNWAKFSMNGREMGLFTYKSLHRCQYIGRNVRNPNGWLYDAVAAQNLQGLNAQGEKVRVRGSNSFLTRIAVGNRHDIHTLTTQLGELYDVIAMGNLTASPKTESDVRVVPIPYQCRSVIKAKVYTDNNNRDKHENGNGDPVAVLTGSYMHHGSFWRETQFMAVVGFRPEHRSDTEDGVGKSQSNGQTQSQFYLIKSWSLDDTQGATKKRTQKNWLPFFTKWNIDSSSKHNQTHDDMSRRETGCHLMFSKKFAPEHEVGEFTAWDAIQGSTIYFDSKKDHVLSVSPSHVPTKYFIRGSAPTIYHPLFKPGLLLGCIHVRGRIKVYRHALFVMESWAPYRILSYSGLFVFKPFRNIEFVTSLYVTTSTESQSQSQSDYILQLSHGSSDCEPRIAIYSEQLLRHDFNEYMLPMSSYSTSKWIPSNYIDEDGRGGGLGQGQGQGRGRGQGRGQEGRTRKWKKKLHQDRMIRIE